MAKVAPEYRATYATATHLFIGKTKVVIMQMYFEVSDKGSINKIKDALKPQKDFYEKLDSLEKKYEAETSLIFHSLQTGLRFSALWFKQEDREKIDASLFKITYSVRSKTTGEYGHEARPRKTNKKFYADFMDGINDVSYLELCKVLFNVERIPFGGLSIEFKERDDKYYFSINRDVVLPYKELTASQYIKLKE